MTEKDPARCYEATMAFLDDHEDGAAILEELVAVDAEQDSWTFEDISLDSGTFGEVVATAIVEKTDGSYRLRDRDAVRNALEGEPLESESSEETSTSLLERCRARVHPRRHGLLGVALLSIVLLRSVFLIPAVFREGSVVFPGNDPYRRLYWVEQLIASDRQPWHPGDLATVPTAVTDTDALFIWLSWLVATLGGNSVTTAPYVLVWLPIVLALLTGLALYELAIRLTGDARIGIAAVFMLAIVPIHATYTALGFLDHHALDYLLLVLIAYSIVLIVDDKSSVAVAGRSYRAAVVGSIGLGGSLAALNIAWEGAPLWFAGVGVYILVGATLAYMNAESPLPHGRPLLAGIALAGLFTLIVHVGLGWLQPYRVLTPWLLLGGAGVVVGTAEVAYRREIEPRIAVPAALLGATVVSISAWVMLPPVSRRVTEFGEYLQRTGEAQIIETMPLFSSELWVLGGPMSYLGTVFFLAVPMLVILTWSGIHRYRPAWIAVSTLTWYHLCWAAVQVRFAGELAPFLALFAGAGFIALLAWVDLIQAPRGLFGPDDGPPVGTEAATIVELGSLDRQKAAYVGVVFIFVAALSFVFIPSFMGDIAVASGTHDSAMWIAEYSDQQGYEYPENYVFSLWGENRQYNYFVNGQAEQYTFAQDHYEDFMLSTAPDEWYSLLGDEAGFVVTNAVDESLPNESTHAILHDRFGSAGDDVPGASHYSARYIPPSEDRVVFEVVPGARVTGTGPADESTTVAIDVEIDGGSFTYEPEVQTNEYGDYGLTVPYAGTYSIHGDAWTVQDEEVLDGEPVSPYRSHWPLDAGSGETIRDPVGDHEAYIEYATWTDGVAGNALTFDGTGATEIRNDPGANIANDSFTVSFWLKGDLTAGEAELPTALYRTGDGAYGFWTDGEQETVGFHVEDIDGHQYSNTGINRTSFDEWTMITGVFDRERGELKLFENDELVETVEAADIGEVGDTGRFALGGRPWAQFAPVSIDSVRFYETALDESAIKEEYERIQRPAS